MSMIASGPVMPTKFPCVNCGQSTSRLELNRGWCPACVAANLEYVMRVAVSAGYRSEDN